eukprot:TRINITY_DN3477_c0_g1_i3.p1 TRINITY_DN3477_c0_g1~~TRINITY_DN3477_c0_g1_i3.p1  ORF type:complete len:312 (+),score=55.74 TRINITY_DN3477_c0_g1_i3:76-1011(+)
MTTFYPSRENSLEFKAVANQPYVIVPSTFNPKIEDSFWINAYCRVPFTFVPLKAVVPTTTTAQGEWSSSTAGGAPNNGTWRNNPQYILSVNQATKSSFSLTLVQQPSKCNPHIGFYIWRARPDKRKVLDRSGIIYEPKLASSVQVSANLTLENGDYAVMPCTYQPRDENRFMLKAVGEGLSLVSASDWHVTQITGAWAEGSDGGCSNNPNWKINPKFFLQVGSASKLHIVLGLEPGTEIKGIGLYIFSSDNSKTLGNYLECSKFVTEASVVHVRDFGPGNYIIMASTFAPNTKGAFFLNIYGEHSVKLSPA